MRIAEKIDQYRTLRRRLGLPGALRYLLMKKYPRTLARTDGAMGYTPRPLTIRGYPGPVWARPHTSDRWVFDQVFLAGEYDCLDRADFESGGPRLIVDCGANVGYASVLFLRRFPDARVIAVEPDPGNFEVCRRNLAPFGDRASALCSAIWSHPTGISIQREPGEMHEWGVKVVEVKPGQKADLQATSLPVLLEESGFAGIDLLKLDIEGAEATLFSGDCDWLGRVRNIVIELHGEACRQSFFDALGAYQYDLTTSGELTVCTTIRPAPMGTPLHP